jgi:hypothetical protein
MKNHTTTTHSAEFSLFENHLSTQASTTTVAEVFQKIIDPNSPLVGRTHSIHQIYNANGGGRNGKRAIAPLKAHLPVAAFGATGDRKVVLTPSGLICVDIRVSRKLRHPLIPGALVRGRSLHPVMLITKITMIFRFAFSLFIFLGVFNISYPLL